MSQRFLLLLLAVTVITVVMTPCSARPANEFDNLDDDYYRLIGKPLPSGYYYVDNGFISALQNGKPVKVARRKDNAVGTVHFAPVLKIKQTHTKKKKLFVPNFFG